VSGSTQLAPQRTSPAGHAAGVQAPFAHTSLAAQAAPPVQSAAAPQWAGSTRGSTQLAPHVARPGAQESAQLPPEHTWPAPHVTPVVQLVAPHHARSVDGSTHLPPQASWPAGHDSWQTPATQTCPPAQIVPAVAPLHPAPAPQKLRSVSGSTHLPPHASWPAGHPAPLQLPLAQVWPAPHTAPPAHVADTPQWFGSTIGSTHAPPHVARFGAQESAQLPPEQTWPAPHRRPFVQVVAPQ
jgi:hypothetical protein